MARLTGEQQEWIADYERTERGMTMGRYSSDKGSFESAPLGNHLGICYRIIDLGLQPASPKFPNSFAQDKIILSFELPNEKMEDGRPFVTSIIITNFLGEKAKLRTWLVAWRGRDFTKEELDRFDLQSILGKPCMVSIVEKDNKVIIGSIAAVPKGMSVPALTNPQQAFWIDAWDQAVFDSLSEKVQAMIKASAEYADRDRKSKHGDIDEDLHDDAGNRDEDIPF